MWSMDVCSKAWLWPLKADSNPSLGEEGLSLRNGSRRSRPSPHGMAFISRRFTTPKDQSKTNFIARRSGREDECADKGRGGETSWGTSPQAQGIREASPRFKARIAGVLQLPRAVTAAFGQLRSRSRFADSGSLQYFQPPFVYKSGWMSRRGSRG